MSNPTYVATHTCDRCGETATMDGFDPPPDWRQVRVGLVDEAPQTSASLCSTCSTFVLGFLGATHPPSVVDAMRAAGWSENEIGAAMDGRYNGTAMDEARRAADEVEEARVADG